MLSEPELSLGPDLLNRTRCLIKVAENTGRGVYASQFISRNTDIEISPVLIFSKQEYEDHGRHTVLDHYTFKWTEGRMALALGLGSLFNHSDPPNVSYFLDTRNDCIRYTTARDINEGEELCIFYGHNLWFTPANNLSDGRSPPETDDGWGGLTAVGDDHQNEILSNPYAEGDLEAIICEEDLPFVRFKPPPEEENPQSIQTVQAWVVDVPDPRHITTLLKWLKQVGLDGPELGHLKRIRKHGDVTTLLISALTDPPQLPEDLNLPAPYLLPVPITAALTLPSLNLKSALWPTMYTPRRKNEPEPWTRGKVGWAWNAMKRTVDAAAKAQLENDELPIAAHIPAPYVPTNSDDHTPTSPPPGFIAADTRRSTRHPLRHASINAIRQIADHHMSQDLDLFSRNHPPPIDDTLSTNGSNYLLTDRTFFVTHEPCIMCSMALLHSRVKEVIYLYPMPKTGGCGGLACLPTLQGVNHRFTIFQWKGLTRLSEENIEVDPKIDV